MRTYPGRLEPAFSTIPGRTITTLGGDLEPGRRINLMALRVAVAGAGIVGACVALRLAQRGADVTLIEARAPGEGTSGTSFAWLDASHSSLEPYVELNLAGLDAWHRLAATLGDPAWLRLTGTLRWDSGRTAGASLLRHARALGGLGHPAQELTRRQVTELEPDVILNHDVESVVLYPREGYLLARPAIGDLLAHGQRAGLRLFCGDPVVGFTGGEGDRVTGVTLASGATVPTDVVVCCVGCWTEKLLSSAGVPIPLISPEPAPSAAVGLLVLSTPQAARLKRVVFADGLMMRPHGAGRLLLHADEQDAHVRADTRVLPPPAEADKLLALARERLRVSGAAGVESATIGIRALPRDGLPVVGYARSGLYVVVTHSGMTLAPALGEIVTGEIIDETQSDALARFRPARFERSGT